MDLPVTAPAKIRDAVALSNLPPSLANRSIIFVYSDRI